jgi:hypothetical protein
VQLAEPVVRHLLARLDGTRGVVALAEDARQAMGDGASGADVEAVVTGALDLLARSALLVERR